TRSLRPTTVTSETASRASLRSKNGPAAELPGRSPCSGCASSHREAEGAHHVAAVVGDLVWSPRRHPDPVDSELVDDTVQRLGSLLLDHVGKWAARRGQRHADDERVILVVPAEVVDQTEVHDVHPELGVHYVLQRLL